MKGFTVLNPIGYDSFGLPTENYALSVWKQADQVTRENILKFEEQLSALDMSFDTNRRFATSDPDYYKRTQWIFQLLYKRGLVYRDTLRVNRCPSCQTVLANDQVNWGKCERCKHEVVQKKMPQWFIKVTDYADRLIEDLDTIDRPNETKAAQKHWIWKSVWATVNFTVDGSDTKIEVFTTRPDTLYGVSALVLAPEQDFLDDQLPAETTAQVEQYRANTLKKTAVERQQDANQKTGVFSWLYAYHPFTKEKLPVRYADYVLPDYATGSVMLVPAHDQRDFDFATKFELPIKHVVVSKDWENIDACMTEHWVAINSGQRTWLPTKEAISKAIEVIEQAWVWTATTTYKLRDWSVSRQRYRGSPIPVYYDEDWTVHLVPEDELPVLLPTDLEDYKPAGKSPLEDHPTFKHYEKDWVTYTRECDTLDTFVCSSFYYLRYPDTTNNEELISKELAKKILPVDIYSGGKEHTVWHLLYSRFIHKVMYDAWYVDTPEPFTKLIHQWMVLWEDGRKMSKRWWNGIDPLESVEKYGVDALRMYMMFMGPIDQDKPWNDRALHGMKKFVDKLESITELYKDSTESSERVTQEYRTCVEWVLADYDALKFNTAVSKIMVFANAIQDAKWVSREQLLWLARVLHPLAPSLSARMHETLWEQEQYVYPDVSQIELWTVMLKLPVQVNWKVRGFLEIPEDTPQDQVEQQAQELTNVEAHIDWKTIKKIIVVPNKICNILV